MQPRTLKSSTSKRTPKTSLAFPNAVYFLPKSAPAKKKPTSLKEWCSRKRPLTYWHYSQPMLGVPPKQFSWCPDHQLLPTRLRPLVTPLIKKEKGAKGSEDVEEGEVTRPLQQPSAKEARMTRVQQKKNAPFRASKGIEGGQHSKASVWKPSFVLSSVDSVMDDATLRDPQKGRSGILS